MRARKVLFIALVAGLALQSGIAQAQFSPRGILGSVIRPFRDMLGRFGHYPRFHRHAANVAAANESQAANGSPFGWAGPIAWPNAYADVIGYTFWPDEYAGQLRARGFDVIADTIAGQFEAPRAPNRSATTGSAVQNDSGNATAAGACNDASAAQNDWPTARIEQTLKLTDAQRANLDRLKTALAQSVGTLKAGCRDTSALPAPDRLNVLVQRLWAVRDAGILIREPLKTFYDSLTAAQKAEFTGKTPPAAAAGNASAETRREYQACAAQGLGASERLLREIAQKVRPTKEQSESLDALRKATSDMAKLLTTSCGQPIAKDPEARLDAADDQLTAMNYAATNMQIALNGFYSKLDGGQKERFDRLAH